MRRRLLLLVGVLSALAAAPAHAQLWSGILAPGRAIDWSDAGVHIDGQSAGIPNRTTVCVGGALTTANALSQINAAITSCSNAGGGVVTLAAGTYNLAGEIVMKSNVTLRGAGAATTILKFSAGGSTCSVAGLEDVCFTGSFSWVGGADGIGPQNPTTWTAGYAKGATQVTLGSTANLKVGQLLILDQQNDTSDTGQVFVCDTVGPCAAQNDSPGRTVGGVHANQQEYKRVVSCGTSTPGATCTSPTVTITPPLYMPNWRSSQSPGAWWATTLIQNAGIENLTLDHTASNQVSGVVFDNAYNCWAKGIRSIDAPQSPPAGAGRNHIWLVNSARTEVRDSYFYGSRNGQNNFSQSYGIEPYMAGDVRIENNIFQHVASPILVACCSGSVFAYNYCIDGFNGAGNSFMWPCLSSHDAAGDMILVEGNQSATGILQDQLHGTHNFQTVFRNHFQGREGAKNQETIPANYMSHSRYANLVGNVLGTGGYHTNYTVQTPTATNCNTSIFLFGFGGGVCGTSSVPADLVTASTAMRWGNYDTSHNAIQFVAGENGSGAVVYPALANPSQTLPASFYLAAQPAPWWRPNPAWGVAQPPWPPIGPGVTGGLVTAGSGAASALGGLVHKIPARLCYENTAADGAYAVDTSGLRPLLFDPSACYFTITTLAPAAPTNPTVR